MRASSSVSFLLSPVKIDSSILVDGGLVANVPVKIASESGGNFIIAVNTTSLLHTKSELELPWMVADQIISIPMKLLNKEQLNDANVIIRPDLSDNPPNDFSDIDSLVDKGYNAAITQVKSIKEKNDSIYNYNLRKAERKILIKNITFKKNLSITRYPSLAKFPYNDSISNYEIIKALGNLLETGDYKNVKAEVADFGNRSEINFVLEKNPLIKNVNLSGV